MHDLLSIETADRLIGEALAPFGSETVALLHSAGRILRQEIWAERALPPYDRVILDGIAIRWQDTRGAQAQGQQTRKQEIPDSFVLAATQPAGRPPLDLRTIVTSENAPLPAAIAVMTGSVLPHGTDTVIPREDYDLTEGTHGTIIRLEDGVHPRKGQHIHSEGSDCAAGTVLLNAGIRLSPPDLAILAANGVAEPHVAIIPSIAIISTGDELVAPDEPVQAWQIRRSNEYAISASLSRQGFTRQSLSLVPDNLAAVTDHFREVLETHDVLVISGGVSMGQFDFVPKALAALNVRNVFHKVAQRPGKPFWFGVSDKGQPVFALPGNPVSALACCSRHVVPALLRAQDHVLSTRRVVLSEALAPLLGMTRLVPVQLQSDGTGSMRATPHPMPTSGDFNRLGMTDGIVSLPPGDRPLQAGDIVTFHEW